jgi:protein DGCR14
VNATRTIIERDFFPDLARLRARTEWIEARDRNDLPALMQLRQRYGRGASHTAAHTPIALQTPRGDESADTVSSAAFASAAADALPSLNEFVATHVSEDDVAYAALAERDHRRFRERVAWLEESAVKAQLQLHAPDSQRLKMWPFQVRNALMWYPHAIDDAAQLAAQGDPATSIAKANTRFAVPAPVNKRRRVSAPPPTLPRLGVPSTRNEADQFGYVQSPALQPGVDVAPIMTWGKIASTPLRVRDGDHSDDEANDDPTTTTKMSACCWRRLVPTKDRSDNSRWRRRRTAKLWPLVSPTLCKSDVCAHNAPSRRLGRGRRPIQTAQYNYRQRVLDWRSR